MDGLKASPLARKIASENGVDLRQVKGSGPGGRIERSDVEAASPTGKQRSGSRRLPPRAAQLGGSRSGGPSQAAGSAGSAGAGMVGRGSGAAG